jgi:hypothetical protein
MKILVMLFASIANVVVITTLVASTPPSGHKIPCKNGNAAPEGQQCCGESPYNPKLITTSEDREEDVPMFGWASGAARAFLGLEGKLTKIKYKETTTVGKVCCQSKINDYDYYKREGNDGAGVKIDVMKTPIAEGLRISLEQLSKRISEVFNGSYKLSTSGTLPGEITFSGSGMLTQENGCSGKKCFGYWSSTMLVGLTNSSVSVTMKKDEPGAVSVPIGSVVASGSVTSSIINSVGEDCQPNLTTVNSGCLRLALKIDILSVDWDILSVGECN